MVTMAVGSAARSALPAAAKSALPSESKRAIADGFDEKLTRDQRAFLYMPFQHSEDRDDQARAIALYAMLGKPLNLDFALRHQAVVDRFDRFPHRNALLGRASTEEERSFLTEPGSSF